MKGILITAVGWSRVKPSGGEVVSGPLLAGTNKGTIYELELNSAEERYFSSGVENYCKQVCRN